MDGQQVLSKLLVGQWGNKQHVVYIFDPLLYEKSAL